MRPPFSTNRSHQELLRFKKPSQPLLAVSVFSCSLAQRSRTNLPERPMYGRISALAVINAMTAPSEITKASRNVSFYGMVELSVGYTAGLVALGLVIGGFGEPTELVRRPMGRTSLISTHHHTARLWLPTAVCYILAGALRDKETAASWLVQTDHSRIQPPFAAPRECSFQTLLNSFAHPA